MEIVELGSIITEIVTREAQQCVLTGKRMN